MELTIETSEMRSVSKNRRQIFALCSVCGERTTLLRAEDLVDATQRTVDDWIESGRVDFREISGGSIPVCVGCLERELRKPA